MVAPCFQIASKFNKQLCRSRFSFSAVSFGQICSVVIYGCFSPEVSLMFGQLPNKSAITSGNTDRPNESREDFAEDILFPCSLPPAVFFASSDIFRIAICHMKPTGVARL